MVGAVGLVTPQPHIRHCDSDDLDVVDQGHRMTWRDKLVVAVGRVGLPLERDRTPTGQMVWIDPDEVVAIKDDR